MIRQLSRVIGGAVVILPITLTATHALVTPSPAISVKAERPWSDAGLTVKKGEQLRFCVSGEIYFSREMVPAGAGGVGDPEPRTLPVSTLPVGALIGSIDGVSFPIGSGARMIKMPASGPLLLGVNDWIFSDNSGTFEVRIGRSADLNAKDCASW